MFCCQDALVAELVDAHASGACGRSPVEVQVLFRAPSKLKKDFSDREVFLHYADIFKYLS